MHCAIDRSCHEKQYTASFNQVFSYRGIEITNTDKKDRKLLAVLRVIADRRPEKVVEVLKLYEPLDTP